MIQKYVIADKKERIEKQFGASFQFDYHPLPCVDAMDMAPVIVQGKPNEIIEMKYGMPVTALKGRILFNSLVEGTVNDEFMCRGDQPIKMIDNAIFMDYMLSQRCILPASALLYFQDEDTNLPLYLCHFLSKMYRPFGIAAIWNKQLDKDTGEERTGFCILSTHVSMLGHRFGQTKTPILLVEPEFKKWLNPNARTSDLELMMQCRKRFEENMDAYPVNKHIVDYQNPEIKWLMPVGNSLFGPAKYVARKSLRERV